MKNVFLVACAVLLSTARGEVPTDVYLLIGQSNMAGRGILTASNRVDTARVLKWNCWQQKGNGDAWVEAVEPIVKDRPFSGACLGASFARTMADVDPKAVIGLVPAAEGNSALSRWVPEGNLYKRALRWSRAALAQGGTLKGILWHQGCAESPVTATNYAARLAVMVAALRRDLKAPDVPFVAGELPPYLDELKKKDGKLVVPAWRTVNEQLAQAAKEITNMKVVSSEGLVHKGDKLHFDTPSLRTLGLRYAEAMRELQGSKR